MFKKFILLMLLGLLQYSDAIAAMARGESEYFLVMGVSAAEREHQRLHLPHRLIHPLLTAFKEGKLPKNTYFLDNLAPPGDASPHFIHGNFNNPEFKDAFKRFPQQFTHIYFDWATLKFLKFTENPTVFRTLFDRLKVRGKLYLPNPAPGLIGTVIDVPENLRSPEGTPRVMTTFSEAVAWRKANKKKAIENYVKDLKEKLIEAGFSVEIVNNKDVHDPIFDRIRTNFIDQEKFMHSENKEEEEAIENFPVLIAEKL